MNKRQRIVLAVGLLVMTADAVAPPWQQRLVQGDSPSPVISGFAVQHEHTPLWSQRLVSTSGNNVLIRVIDMERLFLEWAAILFSTVAVTLFIAKEPSA